MVSETVPTTCRAICECYQQGDATLRRHLRMQYPRLVLEFDAIDLSDDRARRILARQVSVAATSAPVVERVVVRRAAQ